MPKVSIDGLLKGEFVDVIQLDILHDQQPDPGLRLGNDRLRRSFGATDLEDVDIEELLVELVALGVPFTLAAELVPWHLHIEIVDIQLTLYEANFSKTSTKSPASCQV